MKKEDINIGRVIVHPLNHERIHEMTAEEFDIDEHLDAYLQAHIGKLHSGDRLKVSVFQEQSEIRNLLEDGYEFLAFSKVVTGKFQQVMLGNADIPCGDLAFVEFTWKSVPYVAILKLNYRSSLLRDNESQKGIVYRDTSLTTNLLSEAALINLDTHQPYILEGRRYDVNGIKIHYISMMIMECEAVPYSNKDKLNGVLRLSKGVIKKYGDFPENYLEMKSRLYSLFTESGAMDVHEDADKLFDDTDMVNEMEFQIDKYGKRLEGDIQIKDKGNLKALGYQKVTNPLGLDLRIPMELYNAGNLKVISNGNGTYEIIITNVTEITCS